MRTIFLLGCLVAGSSIAMAAQLPQFVDYDAAEKAGFAVTNATICEKVAPQRYFKVSINISISPTDFSKATAGGSADIGTLGAEFFDVYRQAGLRFADILEPEMMKSFFMTEEDILTLDEAALDKAELLDAQTREALQPEIKRMVQRYAREKQWSTYSYHFEPFGDQTPTKNCTK